MLFISLNLFSIKSWSENIISENKIELNIKALDKAWDSRETTEGEAAILKLVQSEPSIPENFEIAWRISRLVYFIGNFGLGEKLTREEHLQVFELGYKSGEVAKNLEPKRVEGHYWFAINLGTYSLTKGKFTALNTAVKARDALLEAAKMDPTYHWGGAYRILGRYYQDLPPVISFGDKKKAEEYFRKAIIIAPNFRLNTEYLAILESDKNQKIKLFELAAKKPDMDGSIEEARYKKDHEANIKNIE